VKRDKKGGGGGEEWQKLPKTKNRGKTLASIPKELDKRVFGDGHARDDCTSTFILIYDIDFPTCD